MREILLHQRVCLKHKSECAFVFLAAMHLTPALLLGWVQWLFFKQRQYFQLTNGLEGPVVLALPVASLLCKPSCK